MRRTQCSSSGKHDVATLGFAFRVCHTHSECSFQHGPTTVSELEITEFVTARSHKPSVTQELTVTLQIYVPVVNFLFAVDPETGQLGEDIDHLEGLQVVDEDVWQPQVVYQLEVH